MVLGGRLAPGMALLHSGGAGSFSPDSAQKVLGGWLMNGICSLLGVKWGTPIPAGVRGSLGPARGIGRGSMCISPLRCAHVGPPNPCH